MKYFHGTTDFFVEGPTAVTLGKFDGVHLGHQKLMRHIKELETEEISSVCFALNGNEGAFLMTQEEQRRLVEDMGISCLISCPFVPEIFTMSPEQFVEEILVKRLHAKYITVGTDFCFGYRRAGNASFLKSLEKRYGFRVDILEKERLGEREISSTYVREALEQGDMELVTSLLGRPFLVEGTVLHGRKLGRTLGFPTINLIPSTQKLLPPNGVYATRTSISGKVYPGITNIGCKPTVSGSFRGVETYLFDVDRDLYGARVWTQIYAFERREQKFSSVEELKAQVQKDIAFGREYFFE